MICFLNMHSEYFNYSLRIRIRFYWRSGHWILMRLARVQESRNVVRDIQMSYFLILVMMSKTNIHICFNNITIDIYVKIILPLGHCLNASEKAWIVFWAIFHIKWCVFFDFLQCLLLESASHPSMLRMDAASICGKWGLQVTRAQDLCISFEWNSG